MASERNLEIVDAFKCKSVTSLGWIKIIELCPRLKEFGITCHDERWNEIMNAAVKAVERRDTGPNLLIKLDGEDLFPFDYSK